MASNNRHAIDNARAWHAEIAAWCAAAGKIGVESGSDFGEYDSDAHEDAKPAPLAAQVRSAWADPGATLSAREGEYCLLLTTGGPALRVIGELNGYYEPDSARLEWQDWGSLWTNVPCDRTPLLTYAQSFYFGG
jgi:hypothetical protein